MYATVPVPVGTSIKALRKNVRKDIEVICGLQMVARPDEDELTAAGMKFRYDVVLDDGEEPPYARLTRDFRELTGEHEGGVPLAHGAGNRRVHQSHGRLLTLLREQPRAVPGSTHWRSAAPRLTTEIDAARTAQVLLPAVPDEDLIDVSDSLIDDRNIAVHAAGATLDAHVERASQTIRSSRR